MRVKVGCAFLLEDLARSLVGHFTKDNLESQQEINEKITQLSEELLNKREVFQEYGEENSREIHIPYEAFPEEMRLWSIHNEYFDFSQPARASLIAEADIKDELAQLLEGMCARIEEGAETIGEIARPAYTFMNQNWQDVEHVRCAKAGVRGAWFYSNCQRGTVVVKGQENPQNQVMGTTFLRCMGINAPDVRMVPRASKEGEQLSTLGDEHGLNKRDPTHYLVMNCVQGASYDVLSSVDVPIVESNLLNLGELLVYDLVLGNFDRFGLDDVSFNGGNIMFEQGQLRPIDTDYTPLEADRLGFTKRALRKIAKQSGDYETKVILKLARNLGSGVSAEIFSPEKFREGMQKAVDKICSTIESGNYRDSFIASCLERGVDIQEFPSQLEELMFFLVSEARTFREK